MPRCFDCGDEGASLCRTCGNFVCANCILPLAQRQKHRHLRLVPPATETRIADPLDSPSDDDELTPLSPPPRWPPTKGR